MLEFSDKYLAVINAVISTVFIIILYVLFGLLRKKFDKLKSFWIIYWALGLIVLLGFLFLMSITIKMNYTFADVAVDVMLGNDVLLYCSLIYFFIMLSIFYLWYKRGNKHISYFVIFWVLSIVFGYLLFKASIMISKYFIILKYFGG
jgi:hypothetical protein